MILVIEITEAERIEAMRRECDYLLAILAELPPSEPQSGEAA